MIGPLSISKLPAIKFDGIWRVLSCIPSDNNHNFPNFGESIRSANSFPLREIDLSWYHNRIMDQSNTSSCVAHGCAAGMEIAWKQMGNIGKNFAPFYIYGWINGGQDAGAMVSDGLKTLQSNGVCPLEDLPPNTMYYGSNNFPQQAVTDAKRFRIAQAYKCNTFDDICQAINLGFTVPLGIMVGDNFSQIDTEGVAPLPNGGGGGHCILGCGIKMSQRYGWLVKIQNSWGVRFGQGGFAYLRRAHFSSQMAPDAFAIQATFDDPQDNDPTDDVPVVK